MLLESPLQSLIVNCDYTEAWMSIMCSPFQNPGRQDDERLEQEDEVQASSLNVTQNVAVPNVADCYKANVLQKSSL